MNVTQQRVISLISKLPQDRSTQEIDLLLPWLKKKSQLFDTLKKSVVIDIIRYCKYERVAKDHVVIKQGDLGDCFYIILNGTVSVFIDSRKSGEDEDAGPTPRDEHLKSKVNDCKRLNENPVPILNDEAPREPDETENPSEEPKKPLDRSQFGRFVIKFESGRSFGEIALISEESVRNASIISDEETDLLVIHRDLYNQTLKTFQAEEYQARRAFVTSHPLFRDWVPRFQRLLEMSLIKETLTYDTPIIKQGDPVNGLIFITKGRANVQMAPSRHGQQYPEMKPFKSSNNVYEMELNRTGTFDGNKKKPSRQSLKQDHVVVRRSQGYAAAERKMYIKNIQLCSVETGEVIGDVETIMGMDTHLETVTCAAQTELYYLNSKNYDRLITKKNPATIDVLRKMVERKLEGRVLSKQGQVPLLKHIHFKLTEERTPEVKTLPPIKVSKSLPERGALFTHLLQAFVQNKAELINPYVPGAVYYRDVMREKAKARDSVRRHSKKREKGDMLRRSWKETPKPRTVVALRNDLQRQMDQQRQLEYKWLLEEYRAEEKLQLIREFHSYKPLPSIEAPIEITPRQTVRLSTAERLAAEKLAAAEANGETAKQYGVFEMAEVRDRHTGGANYLNVAKEKAIHEQMNLEEDGEDIQEEGSGGEETEPSRLKTVADRMETLSNPERSFHRSDGVSKSPESAHTIIPETRGNHILITDIHSQADSKIYRGLNTSNQSWENSQTGTENSSKRIISPLHLKYESPEYRDWETSEETLAYLEERIKNFNVSEIRQRTPVKLQKLARFEKGDDQHDQPLPGGKVLVKRRACPLKSHQYKMSNHRHTKYKIVPRIPNYDQMKKAKMLSYMTIEEQRLDSQRVNLI